MSDRDFGKMYLNEWKPISAELYDFAARCCRTYDTRCDVEQRNYTKIGKEEIDAHYGQAAKMGWDQDAKAWRRFCYDARAASPSTDKESEKGQKCHRHGIDVMNCVACDYPCRHPAPRSTGETESQ